MKSPREQLKFKVRFAPLIVPSLIILRLILVPSVFAHCPLCVAGAGAGLTLARIFGIDDTITGLWIAAFLGAVSFASESGIRKLLKLENVSIAVLRPVLYLIIFGLTLASFYQFNLVNRLYEIFGVHKLTLGMILGGVVFYVVDVVDDYLIKKNEGVYFPYQRIVVTLGSILLLSLAVYFLLNYVI